jgi:hypothetical protein
MERDAKHLFRHLHDARALRRNPIARPYCQNGLQRIHELIRDAADRCRDEDFRLGKEERALRQHAIVTLACLERKPMAQLAASLGISVRQCYRERADICGRLAGILRYDGAPAGVESVPHVDEFQLVLVNAFRRAALGETQRALRDCDVLARSAAPLARRLQALRASATILADFGGVDRAQAVLSRAEQLWSDASGNGELQSALARGSMALLRWQDAYLRADTSAALRNAEEAVRLLRSPAAPRSPAVREMRCESLYALGTARCNAGDMLAGYDCFPPAESELSDACSVSFTTRSRISVSAWKLRCSLVTSAGVWRPAFELVRGLTNAFKQAYASGDFAAAITALDALTQLHAVAGNHDEAFRASNLALLIAEQQASERVKSQLAIRLALKLLPTSYSSQAATLAGRAKPKACDGYHRQLIAYFRLENALAQRRYLDAFQLASEQSDGREYAALTVHRNLVKAAAAQALGKRRTARAIVDVVVPAAERLSSAHTLLDTYRVAAKVTGEARFKRRAREVAVLFSG